MKPLVCTSPFSFASFSQIMSCNGFLRVPNCVEHAGFLLFMKNSKHVANCREYNKYLCAYHPALSKPVSHICSIVRVSTVSCYNRQPSNISASTQQKFIPCSYNVHAPGQAAFCRAVTWGSRLLSYCASAVFNMLSPSHCSMDG